MYEQNTAMVESTGRFVLPQSMDGMGFADDGFADDIEGLQLDYPELKVPGGGMLQWELPTGDPQNPDYTKYLEGIILYGHNNNAYWPGGHDESSNDPPICQSMDAKMGYGEPGGTCTDCMLNQYGSSESGVGKACKNMRTIYLLRSGEFMPVRIALPPTSLRPLNKFINTAFVYRHRRIFSAVVRLGLTRETNTRLNKDYSVVNFTKLYDLEGEELARISAYANRFIEQIKQANQQRTAALSAASAIPSDLDAPPTILPENGGHFMDARVIDGEREKLPA